MDRFVTTLQGEEDEVIERESVDSAATMRQPVTNDRYLAADSSFTCPNVVVFVCCCLLVIKLENCLLIAC